MNLGPVLTIARLTLREASRRRLLIAVAILTLLAVGLSAWGVAQLATLPCREGRPCSPVETKALASVLLILISFMYSFVFTVGAVFVAAPAVAADVESGVALAMLPRPVRRSEVILGKWLGLSILIGSYVAATIGLEFFAISALVGYTAPHPFQAILFLLGESLAMLTLALLLSTRLAPMTSGIIALMLFGLAWIGGIAGAVGEALGSNVVRDVGAATSIILPTDALWRGALYNLQPSLLVDAAPARAMAANPFLAPAPPPPGYVAWAIAWMAGVLLLAILSFTRREL